MSAIRGGYAAELQGLTSSWIRTLHALVCALRLQKVIHGRVELLLRQYSVSVGIKHFEQPR